jgi:hypothetical protein
MTRLAQPSPAFVLIAAMAVGCSGSSNQDATPVARDGSSGATEVANPPKLDAGPDVGPVSATDVPVVTPDAVVDNRLATGDAGPVVAPDASLATGDTGSVVTRDGAADNRPAAGDTRPVTGDTGPLATPDAATPTGSGTVLQSTALKLEVTASPYSYKVTELSSGEVLVSQSATTFTVGSTASASASASGFATTATTLDANLALSGGSNTAHVKFTFTSPEVLQVLLTYSGGTPTNVKEQFNDQGEHYYGIWGYHLGTRRIPTTTTAAPGRRSMQLQRNTASTLNRWRRGTTPSR